MQNAFKLLTLVLMSVLLTSCSTGKLKRRISNVERGLDDVREIQAELSARFDVIESQARRVTGKMQELEYSQHHEIGSDVGSLKQEISRLGKRIPPPALVPLLALEEDETRVSVYPGEEGRFFNNGLTRMRTGSYREALPLFQQLLQLTTNQDLRARTLFWVAVAEEGQGNNPGALRAYHQLSQNYPSHPRVPSTLLRQASVFIRLRDSQTAKLTLQKLLSQFPNSPEARDAKEKLKKLK